MCTLRYCLYMSIYNYIYRYVCIASSMVSGCVVRIPVPIVPIDLQVSLLALPLGAAAVARSARGGAGPPRGLATLRAMAEEWGL